jgi:aminodeoxyfutalosine deaminase
VVDARVLWADGIVTGDGPPIVDGAVVVDGHGRVLDVGPAADVLPRHAGAGGGSERIRGVLVPGLVNAHTHVELSALRGAVPGGAGFVPWVEHLVGVRLEHAPEEDESEIERAVDGLAAFGTVAVGEVTNSLAAVGALARAGFAGWVFHEVFGLKREGVLRRVAALAQDVEAKLGALMLPPDLRYTLAPHTLYSTHPDAVRAILDRAREQGRRTSLHLAEHADERRALEDGDGPVPAWIAARLRLPVSEQSWPNRGPVDLAADLGALAPNVLLVHLTDARPEELARVAAAGAPVVFCPRSNLFIEARLPPLLAARAAGIEPALGTDSLASNSSLDVLAEARALHDRFPQVPPRELVQMATWNGARAMGLGELGRIARGARPGLFAVEGELGRGDPCAFVLRNVKRARRWVVRRGRGE